VNRPQLDQRLLGEGALRVVEVTSSSSRPYIEVAWRRAEPPIEVEENLH
jgi:hypothetical protein